MTAHPLKRTPMVSWYDPDQLLRTGRDVLIAKIFGQHSDHRLLEALSAGSSGIHAFTVDAKGNRRESLWIDYVADLGDGWDSTYAIAASVGAPALEARCEATGAVHKLPRADVVVFGGDEIYPTPTRQRYRDQLVAPYRAALPAVPSPAPSVFAIPGNHDWYDSLVAFTRLFCSRERFASSWIAPQERSYFALRLPGRWWLVGTDVQLGSDLDRAQVDYFVRISRDEMKDGDRIILCNAEPHWIYSAMYAAYDPDVYNESYLAFLEERVFVGREIRVYLAGDLHHYRRHEGANRTQKITVGGGGAFLHPTHELPQRSRKFIGSAASRFELVASFPDAETSRRLCWRNLLFLKANPKFGFVPAVLYPLSQVSLWAALGLVAGLVLFTDSHSKWYRRIAGSVHGLAHFAAASGLAWWASRLTAAAHSAAALQISVVALGGYFVGSFLMGLYLLISLNGFGRHANEAFSALRSPDWKSFLRIRIDANGTLTIFPIGIRRVPRQWRSSDAQDGPALVPDDPNATTPELIEEEIVLEPATRQPPVPTAGLAP